MLSEVERPQDYGIAEVQEGRLVSVEEKPRQPKSNLAVIGAYLFTKPIFESIATLQPSSRGEYEITDAIQSLINRGFLNPLADLSAVRWVHPAGSCPFLISVIIAFFLMHFYPRERRSEEHTSELQSPGQSRMPSSA